MQPIGSWRYRRRFMYATTAFSMLVIGYALWKGGDGEVQQTAVQMAFLCIIGTVGSYVFGATWDDSQARKANTPRNRRSSDLEGQDGPSR